MEDTRQPTAASSSTRYWQAFPTHTSATAVDHHSPHSLVQTRAHPQRLEGTRTSPVFSGRRLQEQQHEIRPSVCIREPSPLVSPPLALIKRENGHIFEQQMHPPTIQLKRSISDVEERSHGTARRRGELLYPVPLRLMARDRPGALYSESAGDSHALAHQYREPYVKEEPRWQADRKRPVVSDQRRHPQFLAAKISPTISQYGVKDSQVKSEAIRHPPMHRQLPSLMECRSMSSLSDTSIPSPRFDGVAQRVGRLPMALDNPRLFSKAERPFPPPRFSFPVNSPSLFSVLGTQERSTASADVLATGTTSKPPSQPTRKPTSPLPVPAKKKLRRARVCTTEGCVKLVVDHGVCIRHGGGKRCNVEGCECRAQNRGLCWKHGGYTICTIDGCTKRAKSRGMCWSHGGGTQCKHDDCTKIAVSRGRCWAHGGGKRCKIAHCQKPAAVRLDDYCAEHHRIYTRQAVATSADQEFTDSDQ